VERRPGPDWTWAPPAPERADPWVDGLCKHGPARPPRGSQRVAMCLARALRGRAEPGGGGATIETRIGSNDPRTAATSAASMSPGSVAGSDIDLEMTGRPASTFSDA
jgi:hypothetical protein